jgi:hypothetical protein
MRKEGVEMKKWTIGKDTPFIIWAHHESGGGMYKICQIHGDPDIDGEEMAGDARLISKAPEMLELLKGHCSNCKAERLEYEHTYTFTPCSDCATYKLISEIEEG